MKWITFGLMFLTTPLWAGAVPSQITYQGTLKQLNAAANGTYTMTFRLTDSAGLNQYWTSGPKSIQVNQGLFSTVLAPLGVDWQNVSPFIEVNVNGQVLLPREPVTSTAYALMCGSIADGSILTGMVALFPGPCPPGWILFTPLQGRFPVGADPDNPAQFALEKTGGDLVHNHPISVDGTHDHGGATGSPSGQQDSDAGNNFRSPIENHTHSIAKDGAHDHSGTTAMHSSLPPYTVMNFCQKQ